MKLLRTLLTTLFVIFMPLGTAYANETCATPLADFVASGQEVIAAGGAFAVISEKTEVENFAARFNVKSQGNMPPAELYDTIVIAAFKDVPFAIISLFKDGCLNMQGRAPVAGLSYLLEKGAPTEEAEPANDRNKI